MSLREKIAAGIREVQADLAFGVAKEAPFDPGDGGIPPAMWDGEPDEAGWVSWKLVPSTLTEQDLTALESTFGKPIPSAIREYFLVPFFHAVDQVSNDETLFFLPAMPSDNPLGEFTELVIGWRPLLAFGYFPFAQYEDAWGPICLKENDGSVIWFDHEELMVDPDELTGDFLQEKEKPIAPSVEAFWDLVFE